MDLKATLYILVNEAPVLIPDLTPTFQFRRTNLDAGQSTNAVLSISNILDGIAIPENGIIRVRIAKPDALSGYTVTSSGTMTSITLVSSVAVDNTDWDFTEDAANLTFILKAGKSIDGLSGVSKIGFTVSRAATGLTATEYSVTAVIKAGSGGEDNLSNNSTGVTVSSN